MNPIHRWVKRREKSVVAFLTAASPWKPIKKASAAFNAAVCEAVLHSSWRLSAAFNAQAKQTRKNDTPLERSKLDIIERMMVAAKPVSPLSAALDAMRKARAHKQWEALRQSKQQDEQKDPKFNAFVAMLRGVNVRQRSIETTAAQMLNLPSAYDARLDRLTPGLRADDVERWSEQILAHKEALMTAASQWHDIGVRLELSPEGQYRVLTRVLRDMGVHGGNTDIHVASHPMCFEVNGRAQLLLRAHSGGQGDNIFASILDTVHEAGHALYRIHMPQDTRESLMGMLETRYAAADECMAMMFDMHVALTPQFAVYLTSVLKEEAGDECPPSMRSDHVFAALNYQPQTMARVQAKPAQYALFMAQYAALERDMMNASLDEGDLPKRWAEGARDIHGRNVPAGDASQGAFQDPHWALGEVGRFSGGYFAGMLMAAQSFEALMKDSPAALEGIAKDGDFSALTQWARDKLYTPIRQASPDDFMKLVTGKALGAESFLSQVLKHADKNACKAIPKPQASIHIRPN